MVFASQMLAQQEQRRQVELSALDHAERDGKSTDEARASDATARFVLAHSEPSNAIIEQRRACRFEIEPPLFDLAEIGEQAREDDASLADERMETRKQLFVGQILEIHCSSLLPFRISTSGFACPRRSGERRPRATSRVRT